MIELIAVEYEQGEIVFAETIGFATCIEDAELEARDFMLAEPWHNVEFIERVSDGINMHWIPLNEDDLNARWMKLEEGMVV